MSRAVVAEFTHEHAFEQAVKSGEGPHSLPACRHLHALQADRKRDGRAARPDADPLVDHRRPRRGGHHLHRPTSEPDPLYRFNSGGRPQDSWQTFLPAAFEFGVFAATATGFVNFLRLGRLPHLADPVFEVPGFERASQDRYFLALQPVEGGTDLAMRLGALRTAEVEL